MAVVITMGTDPAFNSLSLWYPNQRLYEVGITAQLKSPKAHWANCDGRQGRCSTAKNIHPRCLDTDPQVSFRPLVGRRAAVAEVQT
jgi:hypothetical protein